MSDLIDRQALKNKLKRWDEIDPYEFVEMVYYAIDSAPAIDATPRWVRCEERLPDDGDTVLIYCETTGGIVKSHFREIDGRTGKIILFSGGTHHPTHWMPLPEPPKEDEDG